jgi:Tol biopolymer transport system component
MDPDGSNQTNLTKNPAPDFDATVSPNGKRIAFRSDRNNNADIYVMNIDGTGQTRLTTDPGFDFDPTWSPDGTSIAFSSTRDGNDEVYLMFAVDDDGDGNGDNQTNFSRHAGAQDSRPAFSPDGKKIAYQTDLIGPDMEIVVDSLEGSQQPLLILTENNAFDGEPSWSPNGKKIAFESDRDGKSEIYVMNADGSNEKNLTKKLVVSNQSNEHRPAFSPNDRKIAFDTDLNGQVEVYAMNRDGSKPKNLTNDSNNDFRPDWGVIR